MKPLPHRYDVRLDFDGPGDAWSPEHLLLAAVDASFLFTLRAVAKVSKVEFMSLELSMDRVDGVTCFTEIVLRPCRTLGPGGDRARALWVREGPRGLRRDRALRHRRHPGAHLGEPRQADPQAHRTS
jgi:hypothetical protein